MNHLITERLMKMLTGVLSLILICVLSGFAIGFIYLHSEKFNDSSHVHVVVMSLSTLISLTVASLLAVFIHSPFIVSILLGIAVGFIIGKPLKVFAIVDGMVSGLMGGMMGLMAPMMAHLSPAWFSIFMDAIFILLMAVILKLLFFIKLQPREKELLQDKSESKTLSS
ncbi:hypothetical protein PU629_04680 [Pullulanibacillus sp. KACC 23026]|uniref:hypothetical protein n=1 Tax=Pullulanibacillus sp. KACC 23026 TaxID=3028315 RepID=UPI0023AF0353|nr:hypothetical protein [Pullulanibacillus sp. KACC 23026]WEG13666.1 hypothetical protein PU629_04680 [Pullulanibacillus sp. KACC 23026]